LKTSSDRQIIAIFYEIWVAESNGDVRILTGSWIIRVPPHAQSKCGQKCPQMPINRQNIRTIEDIWIVESKCGVRIFTHAHAQ